MSLARRWPHDRTLGAAPNMPTERHVHPFPRLASALGGLALVAIFALPAQAQVLDKRPALGTDDAEERANQNVNTGSVDLELTYDGGTQTVGIRWPGITIPPGATITTAHVQFHAAGSQSEATSLVFAGQAADDPAGFSSTSGNISSRPRTAATVGWSPAAWTSGQVTAAQRTPELKAIIQEIVDRPGWASGNALAIIITGTGRRTATAWDGGAANAPLLHVEYTTGPRPPTAVLEVTQALGPALTVTASAAGSTDPDADPIVSYTFHWGDGSPPQEPPIGSRTDDLVVSQEEGLLTSVTAPAQTASHTYESPGAYIVTLAATDASGLTSEFVTKTITVIENGPPTALLDASQAATPHHTVNATAAGSTDADLWPIASYTFDWGDGSGQTTVPAPTQVASHTYAGPGTFTITLTATDTRGLVSAPATKSLTVLPNQAPTAVLNVSTTPYSLLVDASAAGSTDTDADPIASYTFSWGDGTPSTTVNAPTQAASHTYAAAGTYTVTLTATDTGNLTSAPVTKSFTVTANNPPSAVLTAAVLATPARTVHASGSGSTDPDPYPIASYTFSWGDGTANTTVSSPTRSATHTYAAAGTFTVTLTVKDTGNLVSAPVTRQVTVSDPVTPSTTFDARTAADADDAEESSSGSVSLTGSDLELVNDGNDQVVGIRFPNLAIWSGATITAAWIQFTADESQNEATILDIQAQAIANAPAFTTSSRNVSTRTRTSNKVTWAPDDWSSGQAGTAQRTPDLKSVIQQVVNLTGWAPGNAIAFVITGTGHRTAEASQGSTSIWPLLHVEYTGGTPPPNTAPVAALTLTQAPSPALTVTASAAGSTDTDYFPIASYTFDWGDGTPNTTVNAPAQSANHTYASAGTKTVTVTAKDTGNLTSAPVSRTINVVSGGTGSQPISVWVGYYDTHHSYNPQPKPSPWQGSSNVVFVGTPDSPSGGWDSSAMRIDNLSGGSLTMTVTCDIGSKQFALWGQRTVPAGQSLILAQTGMENFDGSDENPAGCYDCDPKMCLTDVQSTVPVVNVTINGTTVQYYDTQQALNTNGVDYAGCPKTAGRNDESRNWTRIYSSAPGEEPPSATNMFEGDPNTQVLGLSWMAPLFPNPATVAAPLTLQFNIGLKGRAEISIYDVAGRLVKNELTHEFEPGQYQKMIPIAGLSAGMYWCTLTTREGTLKQSFTIR